MYVFKQVPVQPRHFKFKNHKNDIIIDYDPKFLSLHNLF